MTAFQVSDIGHPALPIARTPHDPHDVREGRTLRRACLADQLGPHQQDGDRYGAQHNRDLYLSFHRVPRSVEVAS